MPSATKKIPQASSLHCVKAVGFLYFWKLLNMQAGVSFYIYRQRKQGYPNVNVTSESNLKMVIKYQLMGMVKSKTSKFTETY